MGIFDRFFDRTQRPTWAEKSAPSPRAEPVWIDPDNQPSAAVNFHARLVRNTSEVVGVLRGIIADGQVSDEEIVFLGKWLVINREFAEIWPFNELAAKVGTILQSRRFTQGDCEDIYALIDRITGDQGASPEFENTPTTFPLTSPAPAIVFHQRNFVLTGKFIFGTRKQCEAAILARGGNCLQSITLRTDYLVIGSLASRDWFNTAWGRKIQKAAEYKEKCQICIVNESHWNEAIRSM
jgi:hypothetical protein